MSERQLPQRSKILIFCDWYAPAFKGGGPIRSIVNLVEALKQEYEFYVYTTDTDFGEHAPMPGVVADQWLSIDDVQIYYRSTRSLSYTKVKSLISEINPHCIYLNSMFSNMIFPILAAYQTGKIIIAPRGMVSPYALSVKPIRKFLYLWFLRTFGFAKFLSFHAISEAEREDIFRVFPNTKRIVLANNVPASIEAQPNRLEKQAASLRMVFVGRMHPIKNLHLLLSALAKVNGDVQLTVIATKEDPSYLEKCQQLIGQLKGNIQVRLLLDMPNHEIRAQLVKADLFVLLSEGESFGHAIFEALSVGCPVLISNQTPWRDLESVEAGWDLPISDLTLVSQFIQQGVDKHNEEWQLYRAGAHRLAYQYVHSLNTEEQYRILFEN